MKWHAILAAAGAVLISFSAGGCSGDDGPGGKPGATRSGSGTSGGGPGSSAPLLSEPMTHKFGPAHVELLALNRTSGSVVTARFRVVNDGVGTISLNSTFAEEYLFDPGQSVPQGEGLSLSGVGLLDAASNRLYLPLSTAEGECLCSKTAGRLLKPKESAEVYAMFPAPPADVTRVTVAMPLTVPFQDVPLGSGPVGPLAGQRADPATARLREPRILSVTGLSDGDVESVTEDADNRTVRLSSDVLFALNKADLTDRATAVLQKLAGQINASTGRTVKVDGYTDNTGNDAINEPLSRRRADAVAGRLKTLVTRAGVTYQVAGHGSADPVASNDDERGRRKNRRVTVVFALPKPARTTPSASGTPYGRPTGPGTPPALATVKFPMADASGLVAEINGLHRDATGLTTLVWTVRNTGKSPVDVSNAFESDIRLHGESAPRRGFAAGGVLLVDPAAKVRHFPLSASSGQCLCTTLVGEAKAQFGPGESSTYSAAYKLPPEAGSVEIWLPWSKNAQGFAKSGALPVR